MRAFIRKSCLLLAALLALTPLTSCNQETPPAAETTAAVTTAAETTVPVTTVPPVEQYTIIENKTSAFSIVRSDMAGDSIVKAAVSLRKALNDKFGFELPLATDWVKRDEVPPTDTFEILIGSTNRAESIAAAEKLGGGEFVVEVVSPNRVVILGSTDEGTIAAVNSFIAQYVQPASGSTFSLAADTRSTGAVYDAFAQLRKVESNLVAAPTVVARADSADALAALKEKAPAAVLLDFADGKVSGMPIGDAMKQIMPNSMPAFRVDSQAEAEALMQQVAILSLRDYFVMSDSADVIKYVVETDTSARGILDCTGMKEGTLTEDALYSVRATANHCYARVALLPEWMADTATVAYLQKLLVTVWVDGGSDDTDTELVRMITSGANGIITSKPADLETCYTKYFREQTFARRFFVIGHRGMPSKAPENTVEGSLLAYQYGADIIENDVYLSADGEVVVMHDATIDRTTNGTGNIESMTVAQLKKYLVNKQFGNKYPNCEIPTLAEYFEAFKDNDAHIFIEIKSKKTAIVEKIYETVKKYDFEDRVSIIAFGTSLMRECKRVCPEISVGYLVSNYTDTANPQASTVKVSELVGDFHTTFNPNSPSLTADFVESIRHRGITLWPWTLNDANVYFNQIFWGVNGVTTNYANFSSTMFRSLTVDQNSYSVKVGTAVAPTLTLDRYDRLPESVDVSKLEVIFLEGENLASVNGASVTPTGAGKISFIYSYSDQTMSRKTYHVVSQPITINAD